MANQTDDHGARTGGLPGWAMCLWPWICAALSGLLLALCYPGWDQGWLVWIALTPLIAAVWLGRRPARRAWVRDALLGYLAGIVFFSVTFYWLGSPLAALFRNPWLVCLPPLLSTYLGLFLAFWSWFLGLLLPALTKPSIIPERNPALPRAGGFMQRRATVPPAERPAWSFSSANLLVAFLASAAWVAQEWTRGWLFGGFGWNGLGVALHQNTAIIQTADLFGLWGLSFLVAFANIIAVITVRRFVGEIGRGRIRPHWDFSVMMAAIVACFGYGVRVLYHPIDPPSGGKTFPLRFAAVQPYIPEADKSDPSKIQGIFDKYNYLTHTALAEQPQPQLLLWPEASTLSDIYDSDIFAWVKEIDASTDGAFLFGSLLRQPGDAEYNIAVCLTDHGKDLQLYRKMHLVPFGEYIPARHSFPLFAKIAGELVPGDLRAGTQYTLFHIPKASGSAAAIQLAPLICFEDTVGDLTRRMAGMGASVLVNITNDSWFGRSPGSTQHLDNALFRAIENRRPLLRDANTGITCVVDAEGRVVQSLRGVDGSPFIEGVLFGTVTVPRDPPTTLYMRYGDWFAIGSVVVAFAAIGFRIGIAFPRK